MSVGLDLLLKPMEINIKIADYDDAADGRVIRELLDCYARDPMGGGTGLEESVLANIVGALGSYATAFSVIAYADGMGVGLVNCFESLSTFRCKPLINIHDIVVNPEFRGLDIGHKMLSMVEHEGRKRGCCKLTLEVLEGNGRAKSLYKKYGFKSFELDPANGCALFWEKELS